MNASEHTANDLKLIAVMHRNLMKGVFELIVVLIVLLPLYIIFAISNVGILALLFEIVAIVLSISTINRTYSLAKAIEWVRMSGGVFASLLVLILLAEVVFIEIIPVLFFLSLLCLIIIAPILAFIVASKSRKRLLAAGYQIDFWGTKDFSPFDEKGLPRNNNETASLSLNGTNETLDALRKLREMLDLGLIEQADYDAKKAEIMSRM